MKLIKTEELDIGTWFTYKCEKCGWECRVFPDPIEPKCRKKIDFYFRPYERCLYSADYIIGLEGFNVYFNNEDLGQGVDIYEALDIANRHFKH